MKDYAEWRSTATYLCVCQFDQIHVVPFLLCGTIELDNYSSLPPCKIPLSAKMDHSK